jgi:hypothetical protein
MNQTGRHRKYAPQRSCVVCRRKDVKRNLTRLVRSDDRVVVDLSGKMNGRGAYLCDDVRCWERAMASRILDSALRTSLTESDCDRLRKAMPAMVKD